MEYNVRNSSHTQKKDSIVNRLIARLSKVIGQLEDLECQRRSCISIIKSLSYSKHELCEFLRLSFCIAHSCYHLLDYKTYDWRYVSKRNNS